MNKRGPTREELLHRVTDLEQRLREAESTLEARRREAATVSGGCEDYSQRLATELSIANEELQVQTEELRLQAEEMQAQAEELTTQNEELERLSRELESERALLRTVLDQMPGGVIVAAAPSGKFLLANQQVEAILGRPVPYAESLENYDHFHGRHPDGRPYQPQDYPLARCLTRGESICEEEIAIIRGDGSRGVIQVNAAPVRNHRGEIIAAVSTYRNITARIEREREIQRQASFPFLNPNPVLEADTAGRITYYNEAAREAIDSLGGDAVISDFLPTDFEEIVATSRMTGEKNFRREVQIADAYFLVSIAYAETFETVRLYAIDITQRQRAGDALRRAKHEWERTFDALPDLIAILDNDHRILRANRAMAQALGKEPQDLEGQLCHEQMHGAACPPDICPHSRLLKDGRGHAAELRELNLDLLVTVSPIRDDQGNLVGSIHVARDITERKRAEKALKQAREQLEHRVAERTAELQQTVAQLQEEVIVRLEAEKALKTLSAHARSLIEASLDPLVTISPAGKITDVNRATEEATGSARESLIGSDFSNYFTEPAQARKGYEQVLSQGHVRDYPLRLRHASSRIMDVLYNATIYKNEAGEVQGVFAAARDVTERKRAEEEVQKLNAELEVRVRERTAQLEAANQELEAFSYSVSHDLKAPIRAIDGFSRMLMLEHGDQLDAEARRLLEVVRHNTGFMAQLIDDLLALSRLGRHEIRKARVNLAPMCTTAFRELLAQTPGRHLDLTLKDLPHAYGDPSLLNQVLVNLLTNACKYTRFEETAFIEVGGWRSEEENVYYVQDNGVGFDMRYKNKLFGVFQRLHGGAEFEGTGVGLAIVKRILQRHGGRVWAEGKVGEGATFYFALPAVED